MEQRIEQPTTRLAEVLHALLSGDVEGVTARPVRQITGSSRQRLSHPFVLAALHGEVVRPRLRELMDLAWTFGVRVRWLSAALAAPPGSPLPPLWPIPLAAARTAEGGPLAAELAELREDMAVLADRLLVAEGGLEAGRQRGYGPGELQQVKEAHAGALPAWWFE